MGYFIYLLECSDNSLYCGHTGDLEQRIKRHNAGTGGRYTRTRLPVKLVYSEKVLGKKKAMRREMEIKQCSRKQKEGLIEKNAKK